jgi:hypothetical protein
MYLASDRKARWRDRVLPVYNAGKLVAVGVLYLRILLEVLTSTHMLHELKHHAIPLPSDGVPSTIFPIRGELQNVVETDVPWQSAQKVHTEPIEPWVAGVVPLLMHHHKGKLLNNSGCYSSRSHCTPNDNGLHLQLSDFWINFNNAVAVTDFKYVMAMFQLERLHSANWVGNITIKNANSKGFGRKSSWPVSRHYFGIGLETMRKIMKIAFSIADNTANNSNQINPGHHSTKLPPFLPVRFR